MQMHGGDALAYGGRLFAVENRTGPNADQALGYYHLCEIVGQ